MNNQEIIRAWKDPEFHAGLNEVNHGSLPESPSGTAELEDADLEIVAGGQKYGPSTRQCYSWGFECFTRKYFQPGSC